jgi:transcriptional regulator with XRE-family HTH domain
MSLRVWGSVDRLPSVPGTPSAQSALGRAVAERRAELGLTQEQLALRADLHQRWISNVENGHRNPSYSSLRRLATGLGLGAAELIARAERIDSDKRR